MTDILDNAFGRFIVNVTVPFVKLYCRIFLCKDLRDNIFPVVGSVYYVGVSKAGAYHGTFFHKPQNKLRRKSDVLRSSITNQLSIAMKML